MLVYRQRFMYAVRGHGGWIDDKGNIIEKTIWGNGLYFCTDSHETVIVKLRPCDLREYTTIPSLFMGYVFVTFLRQWREKLKHNIEQYGMQEFIEDNYPPFYNETLPDEIKKRGIKVSTGTLRMIEENVDVEELYEQSDIEKRVLEKWCLDNGITLIN